MPSRVLLLLAVLALTANVAYGSARSLAAGPTSMNTSYTNNTNSTWKGIRLYSLTKFNSTSNLTRLMAIEMAGAKACGATVKAGFMGIHANMSVTPMWGSLIKIYDFNSTEAFIAYQNCSDASPTRSQTKPWESGKLYCIVDLMKDVKSLNGSAYVHASLANVSNVTTYVYKRSMLLSAFSGMSSTFHVKGANSVMATYYPTKAVTNSAIDIAFNAAQAGPAYYYYKKGFGNVPALPLYSEISALQAPPLGSSSFEIEFMPVSVK